MPDQAPRSAYIRHPMLWLAAAFAGGILFSGWIGSSPAVPAIAGVAMAIMAAILRRNAAAAAVMVAAFILAGAAVAKFEAEGIGSGRIRTLYDSGRLRSGSPVEVEGVLTSAPEPSVDGSYLRLRVETLRYRGEEIASSGLVRLFLPSTPGQNVFDPNELKYGSRIRVPCELEREDRFLDPGVMRKPDLLDRQGIDATATIKSGLLIEHIADESVFIPLAWLYDLRKQLVGSLTANLKPSTAGVLAASMFGDRNFLDKETGNVFRTGGTFHILVISGLHITAIGGLLLLVIRMFTRRRWIQFGIASIILWGYAIAVGAEVPVVRAATMFTVFAFSFVIHRESTMLNSLGLAALILLVWRPTDVLDASFQLTFVSVFAIVGCALPLIDKLRAIGKWTPTPAEPFPPNVPRWLRRSCETLYWNEAAWRIDQHGQIWKANIFKSPYLAHRIRDGLQTFVRYLFEGILLSVVVQIWMLPLSVVYFHRFAIGSVILNLWVSFFLAAEWIAAVFAMLLDAVSETIAVPAYQIVEMLNWLTLSLPRLVTSIEWLGGRVPIYSGPGRAVYVIYFIPLLLLVLAIRGWRPFAIAASLSGFLRRGLFPTAAVAGALFVLILLHPMSEPRPDGRLHVDFLDVGQGDSALVTFPDGGTMLIDGGGQFRYVDQTDADEEFDEAFEPDIRGIGEAVVSEYLWERGYSHIDHIVATHADADHIQGLEDVAANFSISSALFGRMPLNDPDQAALNEVLARRRVPIELIARDESFDLGGCRVEVMYPIAADDPDAVSDNDHSVVLRITYGSRSFLFTGDIERRAENELLTLGGDLSSDVVKVAHHGSRTSSTDAFIAATGATVAVISVGRTSPFGHPHADVVERWLASGVKLMTTGERGTISASTDGTDLLLTTFLP